MTENTGRLAYWQAKATLCGNLFNEQVAQGEAQKAVDNLFRFVYATSQAQALQKGQWENE